MKRIPEPRSLPDLLEIYHEKRDAIRTRLDEFAHVPKEEYFYECAYCLLTPQSSAVNAGKAITALRSLQLQSASIDPEPVLFDKGHYIRFHKTKTKNLLQLKERYPELRTKLEARLPGEAVREWLVKNIRGMGWKEASHFLRNIGYRDLAILDRHILKNLVRMGALQELPKTLSPKTYREIEEKFKAFSNMIDIPMDELDLLFWSMETGEILK